MPSRVSTVAGQFFPKEAEALAATLRDLSSRASALQTLLPSVPRAVISPHAGYDFCGALTAGAWAATARARPDRIAILSPSHRVAFDGLAVPTGHGAVDIPGKRLRIDREACQTLVRGGHAIANEEAFVAEHGIDTQLPFAKHHHPRVPVVPVVIGRAEPRQVAALIDRLDRMDGTTLFVLSSDLSHFLSQTKAVKADAVTAALIETGQGGKLTGAHACGSRAIAGWLASGAGAGARVLRLAQATSFATTREASRVVGYGTWALFAPDQDVFPSELRRLMLQIARQGLRSRLRKGKAPDVQVDSFPMPLRSTAACFVTLALEGRLRGCIGSMVAHRALIADVVENAIKAGTQDPRFAPVTEDTLAQCDLKIAVLTRPAPVRVTDQAALQARLIPGETGLILTEGKRRGLFLPAVWESLPEAGAFVAALKRKAGLPEDHWSETLKIETFRAESFTESALAHVALA